MFYLPTGRFVFLAIAIAAGLIHLFYPKHKVLTKYFLLPTITLFYLTAAKAPDPVLVAAFIASWIGDILLEKPGNKWFVIGGISFLLSHLLFIWSYLSGIRLAEAPLLPVLAASLFYTAAAAVIVFGVIRTSTPKAMLFPLFLYLMINSAMNVFAFIQLCELQNTGAALAYVGAVLFFASDCVLFVGHFYNKKKLHYFYPCMSTYISGELLIAVGMSMLHM